MQSPAELGHRVAADCILPVDPKDPVRVGIERHRLAVTLQIGSGRRKIVEGALALDKLQMHQPTGGVVDVDEQGTARPATLEPPVLRPVDLDQLAQTIATRPRVRNTLYPSGAALPNAPLQ